MSNSERRKHPGVHERFEADVECRLDEIHGGEHVRSDHAPRVCLRRISSLPSTPITHQLWANPAESQVRSSEWLGSATMYEYVIRYIPLDCGLDTLSRFQEVSDSVHVLHNLDTPVALPEEFYPQVSFGSQL